MLNSKDVPGRMPSLSRRDFCKPILRFAQSELTGLAMGSVLNATEGLYEEQLFNMYRAVVTPAQTRSRVLWGLSRERG